jgi:superkiller protein 3
MMDNHPATHARFVRCSSYLAWAALFALAFLAGCSSHSDDSRVKSLSQGDADTLSAKRGRFDASEDPPFNAETHFAAGQLAESQNATVLATQRYQSSLKQDPKHLGSLYRLGVLYAQAKQYPQAIEMWQRYVEASSQAPGGLNNLAYCYDLAGQTSQAEATYRKSIARDPKNVTCRVNYGLMLARQGRKTEALTQLKAVLTESQAWYNLGSLYEQQGKKSEARTAYRRALELNASESGAAQRLSSLDQ